MAKSDARFGYQANLNRESHDLGAPFTFTCAPGMLLPIFKDIASPGDAYYIKHNLVFLRTLPLAQPAMIDVKVHFESFFVPLQMLYAPFEDSFFSMKTLQSSQFNFDYLQNNNLPLYNFSYEVGRIKGQYDHSVKHSEAFRLCDMLGLGADNLCGDSSTPSRFSYAPSFFPWQILAYHCIFQYFYRLDDKTDFQHNFNYDDQYNQSAASQNLILSIHQRAWNFDYFTSIYRSPIVSDASMQFLHGNDVNDLMLSYTEPLKHGGGIESSTNSLITAFGADGGTSFNQLTFQANVSTANIRQMFANEKLAMVSGRTRKTYDSQVLAHFGVKVPHDPKHDIALIGSDTYPIHIGEVTSLASTTDSPLGDLAGKGWAQGKGNTHKFVAPCHGVIMTIFSVEPLKRYYGGFDRINAISNIFDLPIPEYDRLGNVPMFRYEVGEATINPMSWTDIIGWKERYYQYKRRPARVSLAFQNGLRYQGTNNYSAYTIATPPFGIVSNTATARPDLESRFYIDRGALDSVMLVPFIDEWQNGSGSHDTENWNQSPWLAYARDPFIVDSNLDIKKVSWLSKDGEPIYNF